jgi:DNA-binding CsgD family transcriptional regulator
MPAMGGVLRKAFELLDGVEEAATAADAGRVFFGKLKSLGFGAIFARSHAVTPDDPREYVYYRETPKGWNDVYAQRGFAQSNFVTRGARRQATPFVWSSISARHEQADREMWGVLTDFGLRDGIAVPSHGPGYLGVISLSWSRFEHGDDLRRAIVLASHYVHERMRELSPPLLDPVMLTPRERDCLAFVAQGKSDWDISQIMGIAESTVHTHVERAKKRLGVKTRMQAVAKLVRTGAI